MYGRADFLPILHKKAEWSGIWNEFYPRIKYCLKMSRTFETAFALCLGLDADANLPLAATALRMF
jgi:hypothetical protein